MPDFIFDLPLLITGPAIVILLCLYGVLGWSSSVVLFYLDCEFIWRIRNSAVRSCKA